jgi:hypothetical protein
MLDSKRDFNQPSDPASRRFDDKGLGSLSEHPELKPRSKKPLLPSSSLPKIIIVCFA